MKLSRLGEFGLIERIRRKLLGGPRRADRHRRRCRLGEHPSGSSLVTADLLIEGIHFDLQVDVARRSRLQISRG